MFGSRVTKATYVRFFYPGLLVAETSAEKVASRDLEQMVRNVPAGAYAFEFYDVVTASVKVEGQTVETVSDHLNVSKRYYVDVDLLTIDDVRALPGDNRILISNMENNDYNTVMRCRTGNFQAYNPEKMTLLRS